MIKCKRNCKRLQTHCSQIGRLVKNQTKMADHVVELDLVKLANVAEKPIHVQIDRGQGHKLDMRSAGEGGAEVGEWDPDLCTCNIEEEKEEFMFTPQMGDSLVRPDVSTSTYFTSHVHSPDRRTGSRGCLSPALGCHCLLTFAADGPRPLSHQHS